MNFLYRAWNITDEMRVDGFGHVYTRYRNRGQIEDTKSYDVMSLSSDRLTSSTGVPRPFGATDYTGIGPAVKAYDDVALSYQAGNVTHQESIRRAWTMTVNGADYFERAATGHQWTWSFYDADERPRVVQQHRVLATPNTPLTLQHEYWYDALGRRILTRTRADSSACGATQLTDPEVCQQAIARTFWDGDQVFREDRQPGGWQSSMAALDYTGGNSAWYGTIRTVTAGAIDVPLVVWKGDAQALVLRRNWRGNVAGATQVVGTTLSYEPTWPAAISDIRYAPDALLSAPPANSWWGSLALDQRDATGLLYRRNRYYDPQTGRFTQDDPIGLAGGMNLYGYAGGDPVNFSDPFGLCPKDAGGDGKTAEYKDCEKGTSGYYAYRETQGEGGVVNTILGLGATCGESDVCEGAAAILTTFVGGKLLDGAVKSTQYLRVGVGRHNGRRVFRAAGKLIEKKKENGHIDFFDMGPIP